MKPMTKHLFSMCLHIVAALISLGNLVWILYIHRVPLISGRGLGSFVVPWFLTYFIVSLVIWLVARFIEKNRAWSLVYWSGIFLAIALMVVVPIKFSLT